MKERSQIAAYFNGLAVQWDNVTIHKPERIRSILQLAGMKPKDSVLDVACGTGVLTPFLIEQDMGRIDGIDIAPNMIKIAREKFLRAILSKNLSIERARNVSYFTSDVYSFYPPDHFLYNNIIIYSAFPHFEDRDRLINHLTALLQPHGKLIIAHSQSRKEINELHKDVPQRLSFPLPSVTALEKQYFSQWIIRQSIDDDKMYLLVVEKI